MIRCILSFTIKSVRDAGETFCVSIQLQWEEHDPAILLFDLRAEWTWDEFHATITEGVSMMRGLPYPVYAITFVTHVFPPSASVLSHFQAISQQLPSNLALIVVVTDNFFVETINQIFFKISPLGRKLGRLAKTMDEARQLIAQHHAQWKAIPKL
jgi:hypothetical protein